MNRIYSFSGLCAAALLTACGAPETESIETSPEPVSSETATPAPDVEPTAEPTPHMASRSGGCGVVTTQGFCGADYGMTRDETLNALSIDLEGSETEATELESCTYLSGTVPAGDVYFMFVDDIFNRVDIRMPGVRTDGGGEVGLTIDAMVRLYPDLEQQPNKYVPDQPDLLVEESGGKFIFETNEAGRVSSYHAGIAPGVDYVEGCS